MSEATSSIKPKIFVFFANENLFDANKMDVSSLCSDCNEAWDTVTPSSINQDYIEHMVQWREKWQQVSRYFLSAPPKSSNWELLHSPQIKEGKVISITASTAANIFGWGYISRQAYFNSFFEEKREDNPWLKISLEHGSRYEKTALAAWCEENKEKYDLIDHDCHMYAGVDQEHYLLATPDCVYRNRHSKQWRVLEIKCPHSQHLPSFLPTKYIVQVLLQMHLIRHPTDPLFRILEAEVFIWTIENGFKTFYVRYDYEIVSEILKEIFYFKNLVENKAATGICKQSMRMIGTLKNDMEILKKKVDGLCFRQTKIQNAPQNRPELS